MEPPVNSARQKRTTMEGIVDSPSAPVSTYAHPSSASMVPPSKVKRNDVNLVYQRTLDSLKKGSLNASNKIKSGAWNHRQFRPDTATFLQDFDILSQSSGPQKTTSFYSSSHSWPSPPSNPNRFSSNSTSNDEESDDSFPDSDSFYGENSSANQIYFGSPIKKKINVSSENLPIEQNPFTLAAQSSSLKSVQSFSRSITSIPAQTDFWNLQNQSTQWKPPLNQPKISQYFPQSTQQSNFNKSNIRQQSSQKSFNPFLHKPNNDSSNKQINTAKCFSCLQPVRKSNSIACHLCRQLSCFKCFSRCDNCKHQFCKFCSEINYDCPIDRVLCLDCLNQS